MTELTLAVIDRRTGRLIVDAENAEIASAVSAELTDTLGAPRAMGCANPVQVLHPNPTWPQPAPHVRINGFWHDSFVEGPGRRSVVRFQGCPIRCAGCWVPQTHDPDGGYDVSISWLAEALLDPSYQRDGVTILGGEPFAQPYALANLIVALRNIQPNLHITIYSGYTYERLKMMMDSQGFMFLFDLFDLLLAGPFVAKRAHSGSCGCSDEVRRWTGSCQQTVHVL